MKSLSTKLVLSTLGVALLHAAFAANIIQASYQGIQNSAAGTPRPPPMSARIRMARPVRAALIRANSGADDNVVR